MSISLRVWGMGSVLLPYCLRCMSYVRRISKWELCCSGCGLLISHRQEILPGHIAPEDITPAEDDKSGGPISLPTLIVPLVTAGTRLRSDGKYPVKEIEQLKRVHVEEIHTCSRLAQQLAWLETARDTCHDGDQGQARTRLGLVHMPIRHRKAYYCHRCEARFRVSDFWMF